jgi:hypothetical protein
MDRISWIVGRQNSSRVSRVSYSSIKINHCIVRAVRPQPLVEGLALDLASLRKRNGSFEWCKRTPIDSKTPSMRPLDKNGMTRDQIFDRWPVVIECEPNVVDRLKYDDMSNSWLK